MSEQPIVTCPCGQKNRLQAGAIQQKCGKCKRVFTSGEVLDAYQRNERVQKFTKNIMEKARDLFNGF